MGTLESLVVLLFVAFCTCDKLQYYLDLIRKEQARSEIFTLPNDSQNSKPYTDTIYDYGTFDHIVVGSGSAGSVVASRLSEDPFREVLVLEAGMQSTAFTDIPGMGPTLLNLEYNWNYLTVPQTTCCLGMIENRCIYPRGKMMGGSSGINNLVYTRGNKEDFNSWCRQNNSGWCYEDVKPFFIKSENSKIDGDPGYHGSGGYLNVEYVYPRVNTSFAFIDANVEVQRPITDYNGARQVGVGFTQYTIRNGRRGSSSRMFLDPVLGRRNLKISTGSHVTKVLINPRSKKAYGVVFAKNNKYYIAKSRKDIVISAGTIGSPQLLMLSGVGPNAHLKSLGINVLVDLAVGRNLQDHVGFSMLHFGVNFTEARKTLEEEVKDYLNGFGRLTEGFTTRAIAFAQTIFSNINDFPDVELSQLTSFSTYAVLKAFFNYEEDTYKEIWTKFDSSRSITIFLYLLQAASKGYIQLKSTDPFDYPLINPMLLSDPDDKDINTMYESIQLVLQLLETQAFKKIGARLHRIHLPACKKFRYLSKGYWYCHIRQVSSAFAHIVGTCKMGPNPLEGAVVNHKLMVHGITNLRVADASIMPNVPAAHTNAPAMMIGEKAAHMIRCE